MFGLVGTDCSKEELPDRFDELGDGLRFVFVVALLAVNSH